MEARDQVEGSLGEGLALQVRHARGDLHAFVSRRFPGERQPDGRDVDRGDVEAMSSQPDGGPPGARGDVERLARLGDLGRELAEPSGIALAVVARAVARIPLLPVRIAHEREPGRCWRCTQMGAIREFDIQERGVLPRLRL